MLLFGEFANVQQTVSSYVIKLSNVTQLFMKSLDKIYVNRCLRVYGAYVNKVF